jgi:hypothetical protein
MADERVVACPSVPRPRGWDSGTKQPRKRDAVWDSAGTDPKKLSKTGHFEQDTLWDNGGTGLHFDRKTAGTSARVGGTAGESSIQFVERGTKRTMVPHTALHAVGQQNKRLKARVAELEAALKRCTCNACRAIVETLSSPRGPAEAERPLAGNGLTRSTGETGGGQCSAAGPIYSPLHAG